MIVAELPAGELRRRLTGAGLRVRFGPVVAEIRSPFESVANALALHYAEHAVLAASDFADFRVAVERPLGVRRLVSPQALFKFDGNTRFRPLPAAQAFPLLEWGLNWCVSTHCHQYLIVHSAVLEREGRALLLPAPPGSGKSTLCAALVARGWRLLSDELALVALDGGRLVPIPRPISLKNRSIDTIARFWPDAAIGEIVPGTQKGAVAHVRPPADSVRRAGEHPAPGWVVIPRYAEGATTELRRLPKCDAFMGLVDSAFNYSVHGRAGFDALAALVEASDCYAFAYGGALDEAIDAFDRIAETDMRPAAPSQGSNSAPAGGSEAREPAGPSRRRAGESEARASFSAPRAWGDHANEPDSRLIASALGAPERLAEPGTPWELLIRCAREADLLATLALRIEASCGLDRVPDAPRAHLIAARHRCRAQHAAVHREAAELARALAPLGTPVVLLKGAAYLMAGLPPAQGRLFSDIDILVPKSRLAEVESALMLAGFATTHLNPYDQRYYRRWMHELPPMQHVKRLTVLDVHHTIVPETANVALDAAALFRGAVPIADAPPFSVLSPCDMVLHSATHLFHNEELTHGLRDLVDIDGLLAHFGEANPAFWRTLVARAGELDLGRPLHYALRFASRLLGTPIPNDVAADAARAAPAAPIGALMDRLLDAALQPMSSDAATRWARRALYLRGHWLKMPAPLLAYHLTWKALRRDEEPA